MRGILGTLLKKKKKGAQSQFDQMETIQNGYQILIMEKSGYQVLDRNNKWVSKSKLPKKKSSK